MLGDELHNILYYADPKLVFQWSLMFAEHTDYHEDHSQIPNCMRMQVTLSKSNNSDKGPFFTSDCGFIQYVFLECEVEAATKSLRTFMNLKAFW